MDSPIDLIADELAETPVAQLERWFERSFVGIVHSYGLPPAEVWWLFYTNTLRRLLVASGGVGSLGVFGLAYRRAAEQLLGTSFLDVGTCFGFFPVLVRRWRSHLAAVACDRSLATVRLARTLAQRAACDVHFLSADVCSLPFPANAFDTVVAIHLLEHLPPIQTPHALVELLRVARRRLVLVVPLEATPDPRFGHQQAFSSLVDLASLGQSSRWLWRVANDAAGGWLVLDAPPKG